MTDADGLSGTPRPDPARLTSTRIGDRDGGVSRRLLVRCRTGALVLGTLGVLSLLIAAIRSWGMVSAGLVVIAAGLLAGAVLLAVRAGIWSAAAGSTLPAVDVTGGADAIVGAPRALSPGVPSAPVKRKLGAKVVPLHAFTGPQPGGGALIVHARADAEMLAADDQVKIWRIGRRGAVSEPVGKVAADDNATSSGRFVLHRIRDGRIFLATSKLTDTW